MHLSSIVQAICDFLSRSPLNTIPGLGDLKIFDLPLVGVAGVDDPLFDRLKDTDVIGPNHMAPREWLESGKSVISYFLPFTQAVRQTNRQGDLPSSEWLYGRIEGEAFNNSLREFLVAIVTKAGFKAVSPALDTRYATIKNVSNWSERHAAFIAGLGTFSLNCSLITRIGSAGRIGSVIVDFDLSPTQRYYQTVDENCTKCGACILRCPPRAISMAGKDHAICAYYLEQMKERFRPRYGCGKCQTGVPCETSIPVNSSSYS